MTRSYIALPLLAATTMIGCSGALFTDEQPSTNEFLSEGNLSVDARTEKVFALRTTKPVSDGQATSEPADFAHTLYAVDADTGETQIVADLSGSELSSIHFPEGSVMVQSFIDGAGRIELFDPETLNPIDELQLGAEPYMLAISPSGRFIMTEGLLETSGLGSLMGAHSLESIELPNQGGSNQTLWMQTSDRLLSVAEYNAEEALIDAANTTLAKAIGSPPLEAPEPYLEILIQSVVDDPSIEQSGAPVLSDVEFSLSIPLEGNNLSRISISPDDRYLAMTMSLDSSLIADPHDAHLQDDAHRLLLIDLSDGSYDLIHDMRGTFAFTPDSTAIVGWGYDRDNDDATILKFLDTESLSIETAAMAFDSLPHYYITSHDNFVIVDAEDNTGNMLLLDVDSKEMVTFEGPNVDLSSPMTSRPEHNEVYLLDDGLYRIDYDAATVEAIDVSFVPADLNILPEHDMLALWNADTAEVAFFDLATQSLGETIHLPEPTLPE